MSISRLTTVMKKRALAFVTLFAITSGTLFYFLGSKNVNVRFQFIPGSTQEYQIQLREVTRIRHEHRFRKLASYEMEAKALLKIFGIRDQKVFASWELNSVQLKLNGERQKLIEDLLKEPLLFEMSLTGEYLSFHFSPKIAREDEDSISGFYKRFQFVLNQEGETWETKENDAEGTFVARYKLTTGESEPLTVTKQRIRYLSQDPVIRIRRDRSVMRLRKGTSWASDISGDSRIERDDGTDFLVSISTRFQMRLMDKPRIVSVDPVKDYDEIIAYRRSQKKNKVSIEQKLESAKARREFAGINFSTLVRSIFQSTKKFDFAMAERVSRFLKLHPEDSHLVLVRLRDLSLSLAQKNILIHALQIAGTNQAQMALAQIMNGREYRKEVRIVSAIALGQVTDPTKEAIDQLWDSYLSRENPADREVSDTAILALARQSAVLKSRNPELAKSIDGRLQSEVASIDNADTSRKVSLLLAAGNTSEKNFIPFIQEASESNEPVLRQAALSSTRRFEAKKVTKLLLEHAEADSSASVRKAAIRALSHKPGSPEIIESLLGSLRQEQDASVRKMTLKYFLKFRNEPGVKENLREYARKETNLENKSLIELIVNTKK